MSANPVSLVPSQARGWRIGLANMLTKENGAWWRTRRWWVQCLLWSALCNGSLALNIANGQHIADTALNFLYVAGAVVPIAATILGLDSILGERHSGTAAWVLSKPLRRPAFILSKLIAYGLGFLATAVVLPGAIAYLQLTANGLPQLPVLGYAGAMGLVYLNLLFYLTLALMLATLFNGLGPGLGISLFLVWGWMLTDVSVWLADVMPWRLGIALGPNGVLRSLGGYLMQGQPLPTVAPIITTVLWCLLFVVVAIWRIRREEF